MTADDGRCLPYDAKLLDAVLLFLAHSDEQALWTLDAIATGVEKFVDAPLTGPPGAGRVESAVERLVDGWALLVWQDPLHVGLTDAGRRAWRALQHRVAQPRKPGARPDGDAVVAEVVGAR